MRNISEILVSDGTIHDVPPYREDTIDHLELGILTLL